MRSVICLVTVLLLWGCVPRVSFSNRKLPVLPGDNLILGDTDTTLVGTVTMLSDKLQALDVVEIEGDWAVRRGRLMFSRPIRPYHGGAVEARIEPSGKTVYGYIHDVRLLGFKEIPLRTGQALDNTNRMLDKQQGRLQRFLKEAGFEKWDGEGFLNLEGFDPGKGIVIYSMAGGTVDEGNILKTPVLVVWATPGGKVLKLRLITLTRFAERR